MSSPPIPFMAFDDVIRSRIRKVDTPVGDWKIISAVGGFKDELYVFPTVSKAGISTEWRYEVAKYRVTLSAIIASNLSSWKTALPKISYECKPGQTVTANLADTTFSYELVKPAFTVTTTTNILDGLSTIGNASARIVDNVLGGLMVDYDPSRSGLKGYRAGLLFQNCKCIRGGDVYVSYTPRNGPTVSVNAPWRPDASATVIATPFTNDVVVGAEYRSPCGAQILGFADIFKKSFGLTVTRRLADMWRVTFSLTTGSNTQTGVSFTRDC